MRAIRAIGIGKGMGSGHELCVGPSTAYRAPGAVFLHIICQLESLCSVHVIYFCCFTFRPLQTGPMIRQPWKYGVDKFRSRDVLHRRYTSPNSRCSFPSS
ncbi:hypothetical protein SCLCIDRAFT_776030 [Scleroderma citrinum Foug A]|uniref:Uncharacterized protein n=1 Tax=Scleroderma citrinum Foug A TaxID=1036808 RepID=A0A0C3CQ05_9AGAM|nr:hypothetical protein SCLCIDRAFT_776030 [Scleroderma citrinum Foug A]